MKAVKSNNKNPTNGDHFAKFCSLKNFNISGQKYSIQAYKTSEISFFLRSMILEKVVGEIDQV
tara:strand:+ start:621 stop:809 length:189 start_codon:yes stop_codon:yes gene_type:complete